MLQGSEVPTANNYSSTKRYPPLPIEISTNIIHKEIDHQRLTLLHLEIKLSTAQK